MISAQWQKFAIAIPFFLEQYQNSRFQKVENKIQVFFSGIAGILSDTW